MLRHLVFMRRSYIRGLQQLHVFSGFIHGQNDHLEHKKMEEGHPSFFQMWLVLVGPTRPLNSLLFQPYVKNVLVYANIFCNFFRLLPNCTSLANHRLQWYSLITLFFAEGNSAKNRTEKEWTHDTCSVFILRFSHCSPQHHVPTGPSSKPSSILLFFLHGPSLCLLEKKIFWYSQPLVRPAGSIACSSHVLLICICDRV